MDAVLVTVDSLRADHCGWHHDPPADGGPDPPESVTPNLDSLAGESLTFETAISPGPRTLSSVPVSHTGVPFASGEVDTSVYERRVERIRSHVERFETVSETLQAAGYTTLAFTANPWTSRTSGFDAGFDTFVEVGRTGGGIWSRFQDTPLDKPARLFDRWVHDDTWFCRWRTFYDDLRAAIEAADGPVFAWVFLLDPHNPYLIPRQDRVETSTVEMYAAVGRANRFLRQVDGRTAVDDSVGGGTLESLSRAYRDCIRSVDTFVGRLRSDLADETLLVFHSDHGEALGDHGGYGHAPVLYEENVHVPLLVHGVDSDATVDRPVSTAAVADILRSYALGDDPDPRQWTTDYAVARTEDDRSLALRGERWKYVTTPEGDSLYDLAADPGETTDRSDENPEALAELRAQRDSFLAGLPEAATDAAVEGDEAVREHLQSLGYL
jgi:arylsulfatase A-like enzyme